MHIKFVSTQVWAPWGGSELLWSQTAQWLASEGVTVSASVHGWPDTPRPISALRECGVHVWERRPSITPLWQRLMWKFKFRPRSDFNDAKFREWLTTDSPDLVCFSDGAVAYFPRYLAHCLESGVPYANVAQANGEIFWPVDDIADEQFRVLEKARRCFFVSHGNLKLCELQLGHRLSNAEVVSNPFGVDYDIAPSWPQKGETDLSLACVARLEPTAKGQDILFRVLAMEKWRSRSVSVSLYGNGPMAKSLQRLSAMLGVGDYVHFAGLVEDIEDVWKRHHALILPSRCEGLPIAAVEAMLCHRAVITTKVGGNGEIVDQGITGFLASSPDVEALDAALEEAWCRREQLKEIGLSAGRAIRKMVPRHPEREFGKRLIELARCP